MRILRIHILRADTCGGLLDGFSEVFHAERSAQPECFEPLCLIGPNGSGKSQLLQILAEIFQAILAYCVPGEERTDGNPGLLFEIEYMIWPRAESAPVHVLASRRGDGRTGRSIRLQRKRVDDSDWIDCDPNSADTHRLLPWRIVGYTSGHNETLSLPFLHSRSAYAEDVRERALAPETISNTVPETRLMLIDYGTHLEVLVANLVLGSRQLREALLEGARVADLHSFRCIVQLNHRAAPKVKISGKSGRKGVQLTDELRRYIDHLRRCATCFDYDSRTDSYTFDFWVNDATREAFRHYWTDGALQLYSSFHKLAMLNDLALPKRARERLRASQKTRRFASRLPEPQDEDKVFRFERVNFLAPNGSGVVDYVSLSDGEHQLTQILGTVSMLSNSNVVLLLDEPESHFNPQWRVRFLSLLAALPTAPADSGGLRMQECILTTHAPFVPSDMSRERVLIFRKDSNGEVRVRRPDIETFGSTFDTILEECFNVSPPISQISRDEINLLMESSDPQEVRNGMERLGHSVEKALLAHHLRTLLKSEGT